MFKPPISLSNMAAAGAGLVTRDLHLEPAAVVSMDWIGLYKVNKNKKNDQETLIFMEQIGFLHTFPSANPLIVTVMAPVWELWDDLYLQLR